MIRHWIHTFDGIVWALWFGGIIGLFISVQTLFHTVPRDTFVQTAPHLFFAFERYQLALAAIGLATTLIWRITDAPSHATIVFWLMAISTLLAVVETAVITPRIEQLRVAGQTHSPRFMQLHGTSMGMYVLESVVLLAAGVLLMLQSKRETDPAFAAEKSFPVAAAHPAS